ncbi:MAG TPA: lactonase family protein [Chitinophagaceae bacterium]|nr:lactonase family protein [Chitinophagaceae bacterium]
MKKHFISFLLIFLLLRATGQEYYLLVGTYDSPKSEGIYVYKFNSKDGSVREISHVKTSNPSFLAIPVNQKYVYSVNETGDSTGKGGGVSSFSFNKKTGILTAINRQSSEGNSPCYITVDQTGKWVIAGNYSTGNFSILPVSVKGVLGKASQVIQHKGSGLDTTRQRSPHVHAVFLKKNNYDLYVPDLGIDKIMTYHFDAKTGRVIPSKLGYVSPGAGSGPRHIDIHPNGKYVYLVEELSGSIAVFRDFGNGDLHEIQSLSALPLTYKGPAGSADIHVSPDGKFLYSSNRGSSNTIAIFSIDAKTGMIKLLDHQNTLGLTPRNFNFDPTGKFLLAGNQNSNEIIIFKRDLKTGLLTDTGKRILIGKPVCLKWVALQ